MRMLIHALHRLRRAPGFTLAAILIVGLGVGAATALFSLVDGVLLRPLPYRQPRQLVWMSETWKALPQVPFSLPDFQDARARSHGFSGMAVYGGRILTLTGHGAAQRLSALTVGRGYFHVLGIHPVAGRLFTAREMAGAGAPAVLISRSLWVREFASSPHLIGHAITLSGHRYVVAGVLPAGFSLDLPAQLCLPLDTHGPNMSARDNHPGLSVVARLRPGVSLPGAQAEMSALARSLARKYPRSNVGVGIQVIGLHRHLEGDARAPLALLMSAVVLLFLIACANLSGLLLARGLFRQREMAVRVALGASRLRLVWEILIECVLLALAGGAVGWWLAAAARSLLAAALPAGIHLPQPVAGGLSVFLFAVLASLVAGLAFGLPPALQAAAGDPAALLQAGGRASHPRAWRWQRRFVIAEIALTMLLLVGSGLLLRGFVRLLDQPVGFHPRGVLTAQISLPTAAYASKASRETFIAELTQRLQHLPGVEAAGAVTPLPYPALWRTGYAVEGVPTPAHAITRQVQMFVATPGYFRAMGIPLLSGSLPAPTNAAGASSVVVSRSFARRWWPHGGAIGQHLKLHTVDYANAGAPVLTITGVAGDVRVAANEPAPLEVYLPVSNRAPAAIAITLRTSLSDPLALAAPVRRVVASLDPAAPVYHVESMSRRVEAVFAAQRLTLYVLASFAAAALLLAAVGLFGVISYLVTARRREIGIRMALGADGRAVRALMLKQALRMAAWGVVIGAAASLVAGRVLAGRLFDVPAWNGSTLAAVAALLLLVTLLASWLPARRATQVDPLIVLHED